MQQSHVYYLIRSVIIVVYAVLFTTTTVDAQTNGIWAAKIVSIQGKVEYEINNNVSTAVLNKECHIGDKIIVGADSRATIMLKDDTVIRLDQNTTIQFKAKKKRSIKSFWLRIDKGVTHFISRITHRLNIQTPIVNGSIEGTEFVVSVIDDDHTTFTVFEGRVRMEKNRGIDDEIYLESKQSAEVTSPDEKFKSIEIDLKNAVQWTLHYPPVIYYSATDFANNDIKNSINFYWKGKLIDAFTSINKVTQSNDPRFFLYRAGLFLTVGRVDEANSDIDNAEKLAPGSSNALALKSIIELSRNNKIEARKHAENAVMNDNQSASALIALSYVLQADFDINGALTSIKKAVNLSTGKGNPLAKARLAELWLSKGYLDKAVKEANEAVELNPDIARAQAVLGFAYLTQIKTRDSKKAFKEAIRLEPDSALPHFGLGLAKIREGDIEEGIDEIEIARAHDRNNSLIRSYLGKAYFDEKSDGKSSKEFAIAKELDDKDPTPWFYDAIRKQTLNRPVEALHDMQKSIELNDNRAVYRSKFLLDEDLAARSASVARIYRDLGFQQRALFEGWRSLNVDPGSYSAHRFLSDSYSALPRHEIARVSELLQSQLLQPINITPIQPQLAQSNLFMLEGAGPAAAAFNEFNPLFNRNRLALQASGIIADKDTQGDDIVQSGVLGRVSYSLSQYHYETDGFRKNNNLNQDIYDAFVQISLSHKTSIQAEYRYFDDQRGDLSLRFDPDNFDRLSQKRQTDTLRLGFRHSFTPYSETIASFIYQNSDLDTRLTDPDIPVSSTTTLSDGSILRLTGASVGLGTHLDENSWTGEIRHLFQSKSGRFYITAGVGRFNSDRKNNFTTNGSYTGSLQPFPPLPIFSPVTLPESSRVPEDNDIRHTNFYIYSLIKPPKWITSTIGDMTWTIGGCMDFFEGQGKEKTDQFNPKFGLTWNPFPGTTIRGALFRTLKRQLVSNQTIEPTQVAGFNQFFDDTNGTIGWRYGIAIDQKFSKSLYAGAEFSRRDLDVVKGDLRTNSVTYARFGHDEDLIRTYLNWTPEFFEKNWLSMSAEYQYEWIDKEPGLLDLELFERLRTHRVPLGINFFHPSGFSARLKSTYVDQAGRFADTPTRMTTVHGHDNFWYFDGSISYRLPKRHGIISIGAQNLFNKNFNFQDTDPTNPQIVPEQLIFARFTLSL